MVRVKPFNAVTGDVKYQSPSLFWRPLGLTFYQDYDRANQASPFRSTELIAHFRPVDSSRSSLIGTNQLDPDWGLLRIEHRSSVTDRYFECTANDASTFDEPLKVPAMTTDSPPGSASYWKEFYGARLLAEVSDDYSKVYASSYAPQSHGDARGMVGATVEVASGRKFVRISNQATDRVGARERLHDSTDPGVPDYGILVEQEARDMNTYYGTDRPSRTSSWDAPLVQ